VQENLTAGEVIERFCQENATLAGLDITITDLQETLCGDDTASAQKVANQIIQYAQDISQVGGALVTCEIKT